MKLIESKAEYIPQAAVPSDSSEVLLNSIYKSIELAGRTAYHSQDKITLTSAKDFVDRMIASHHGAALEHGTVYLKIPVDYKEIYEGNIYAGGTRIEFIEKCPYYNGNHYSKSNLIHINSDMSYPNVPYGCNFKGGIKYQIVTTNYRNIVENNWIDDLQYLCSPTEFHEKRYTMRFTCSRAIAQELTRHRVFSFLMESQRYINYSKEKHGGELTLIRPDRSAWERTDTSNGDAYWAMLRLIDDIEIVYMEAIKEGVAPQTARDILPNITKTELIMTGFSSDWRHVLDLRLFEKTGKVAPDMLDLMQKAQKSMQEAGIWEDIISKPSKFE